MLHSDKEASPCLISDISTSTVQPLTSVHTSQHISPLIDPYRTQHRNPYLTPIELYPRDIDTLNCSSPNRASRRAYVLGPTVTVTTSFLFHSLFVESAFFPSIAFLSRPVVQGRRISRRICAVRPILHTFLVHKLVSLAPVPTSPVGLHSVGLSHRVISRSWRHPNSVPRSRSHPKPLC
jgi:hypothetical protein